MLAIVATNESSTGIECFEKHDNLEAVISSLIKIEIEIESKIADDEISMAKMRIESGRCLLRAKSIVKSSNQKWEIEVSNIIPKKKDGKLLIESTCRCERMKVAKMNDVDDYIDLGWRKLVKLSQRVRVNEDKPIRNYLKRNGYDIKSAFNEDFDAFDIAIDVCFIQSNLKQYNIRIGNDLIEQAVRRKLVFDEKFIKHLASMDRPDAALRAKLYYDVTKIINIGDEDQIKNWSEIEELMEKLAILMCSAVKNNKIPSRIPLYMYDDLAHWNGMMFGLASKSCL